MMDSKRSAWVVCTRSRSPTADIACPSTITAPTDVNHRQSVGRYILLYRFVGESYINIREQ